MEADFVKLEWTKGERVLDWDGIPVGKVAQIASEPHLFTPQWLVVKTSAFGRLRLVPVDSAVDDGHVVRVPFTKETVLAAPVPAVPTAPAATECAALEEHYYRAA